MNFWFWDDWLINKFEKFAHKFQQQTGKTNYFLTKICYWCVLLIVIVLIKLTLWNWVAVIFVIAVLASIVYGLPSEEKSAFERIQNGAANPRKVNLSARFFRLFSCVIVFYYVVILIPLLFITLPDGVKIRFIEILLDALYFFFFTLGFYFSTCDPIPPCSGKLWDKISAFFAKPVTMEAGNRTI